MVNENLEQKDVKEFLDKLTSSEIDDLHEHCVREIKDCSLSIPEEILELMRAEKEEKETKKKKSLWEIFCNALGDDQEGHEEIWNSLTLDEKRHSISTAFFTWTTLIKYGVGAWLSEQIIYPSTKTNTTNPVPKGGKFLLALRDIKTDNIIIAFRHPKIENGVGTVQIPKEYYREYPNIPDVIFKEDESLYKFV